MKVSIIGMGAVGTEIVGNLINLTDISEIVAVDRDRAKAEAEIWDFAHTTAFTYSKNPLLTVGDYPDTAGSDIVVVTAGTQLKAGQTRGDLVSANAVIVRNILAKVRPYSPNAILIMVTNPVDVLAWVAVRHCGWPRERVISAGTVIDSARFLRILSDHVGIDPKNIFGYVLGEHGSTSFIPWSICNVCGLDLDTYCQDNGITPVDREQIHQQVLDAGFEIFRRKGNTNHGIAASVFRIIRAIETNEHSVLPVGALLEGEYQTRDVVISVPCVVGRSGIERVLSYTLAAEELAEFRRSEGHLRELAARAEAALAAATAPGN